MHPQRAPVTLVLYSTSRVSSDDSVSGQSYTVTKYTRTCIVVTDTAGISEAALCCTVLCDAMSTRI